MQAPSSLRVSNQASGRGGTHNLEGIPDYACTPVSRRASASVDGIHPGVHIRDLTFNEDWLPAIAGTAAVVAQYMGGEYRAGFWMQDMLLHLLWYANNKYPRADKPRSRKHHDRDYAAS